MYAQDLLSKLLSKTRPFLQIFFVSVLFRHGVTPPFRSKPPELLPFSTMKSQVHASFRHCDAITQSCRVVLFYICGGK